MKIKRLTDLVPPRPMVDVRNAGKSKFWEYAEMNKFTSGASDHDLRSKYIEVFGRKWADKIELHRRTMPMIIMALEYYAQVSGALRVGTPLPPRLMERYEASARFDKAGLKRSSEFLVQDYRAEGEAMKNKKKDKAIVDRRKNRVTAASILIPLLGRDNAPGDAELIKTVKAATGSEKFDGAQLAWYKWKFRQGKLKGQDGTRQAISQGSPLKAKKKVIVKRKK